MNLANCNVTIATMHDGSTLEISGFFQGLKCCCFFSFGGKKCGSSTRILHLKDELVLFCFISNIVMGRKDVDALCTALAEFPVWSYVMFSRSMGKAEQLHTA